MSCYNSISHGDDHKYSQTEVCILCRFDSELRCFRRTLSFGPFFMALVRLRVLGLVLLFEIYVSNERLKTSLLNCNHSTLFVNRPLAGFNYLMPSFYFLYQISLQLFQLLVVMAYISSNIFHLCV